MDRRCVAGEEIREIWLGCGGRYVLMRSSCCCATLGIKFGSGILRLANDNVVYQGMSRGCPSDDVVALSSRSTPAYLTASLSITPSKDATPPQPEPRHHRHEFVFP